jgi:signal transduction histidine kinase
MPRDREALPRAALPALLLGLAFVSALLAWQPALPGPLGALALLSMAAGGAFAGALWSRQRQRARLRDARQQHLLLGQLLDVWLWQTDAEHRLVRLQPPQGAPTSSWVEGAFSGEWLWQRFDDDAHTLRSRMQARAPLHDLVAARLQGTGARRWRLRGLPRHDADGGFAGYLGIALPLDAQADAETARQGFEALLRDAPLALFLAQRGSGGDWVLARCNPAARRLLGLDGDAAPLSWDAALARLPDKLGHRVAALAAGDRADPAEEAGWTLWLASFVLPDGADSRLLTISRSGDDAARSLADDYASFSYTITHDLRAPIRVVEGFARILKEDYGGALDRVGNDHLDRVLAAAARMNAMIDAMLSLSRLSTQPLARQPVDLSQLARHVAEELQRAAPERLADIRVQPGLGAVGDPTLLRTVIENLLGNAWKYTAKVGRAEIAFEQVEQDGRRVYVVRDNGAGFDMRFADRLFGVFHRLHGSSEFPGHGVGLASVRRIVGRHGGQIWADAEVGQGARFYFTLGG